MFKSPCPRCAGEKTIAPYKHVLGGVCFRCNGAGYVMLKNKPAITKKYKISAVRKEDGVRVHVYNIAAISLKKALQKAQKLIDSCTGYTGPAEEI